MLKSFGALLGGVFVGVLAVKILRQHYPETVNRFYSRSSEITNGAKEAFRTGYINAFELTKPH